MPDMIADEPETISVEIITLEPELEEADVIPPTPKPTPPEPKPIPEPVPQIVEPPQQNASPAPAPQSYQA